jgi:lipid-binding SYLF domain-containing protein
LPSTTHADTAAEIDRDVTAALNDLYRAESGAEALGLKAEAILVFPDVIKAGLIIGGQYGEGAMRRGGKTTGYYSTVAASYGLQAGVQSFGYPAAVENSRVSMADEVFRSDSVPPNRARQQKTIRSCSR